MHMITTHKAKETQQLILSFVIDPYLFVHTKLFLFNQTLMSHPMSCAIRYVKVNIIILYLLLINNSTKIINIFLIDRAYCQSYLTD